VDEGKDSVLVGKFLEEREYLQVTSMYCMNPLLFRSDREVNVQVCTGLAEFHVSIQRTVTCRVKDV
jgi:hypothetical protein